MKRSTRTVIPVSQVAAALAAERFRGGDLPTLQGVALGLDIPWSEIQERLDAQPSRGEGQASPEPRTAVARGMVICLDGSGGIDPDTDSDSDGIPNCQDVFQYIPIKKGDVNNDNDLNLKDAILCLQTTAASTSTLHVQADVNGDMRIGVEETIYILQDLCGLR